MPRTYGTTNIAPYASAPAVGPAGDTYYNTASKITYISDGSQWNALQGATGGGGGGAPYAPVTGTAPPPATPVITPPTGLLWVDTATNPSWSPSVGPGVPAGGATGTYLQKRSATDYDTVWTAPSNLIYYQTIAPPSAGSTTTITHNLGSAYVHVQLWDAVTGLQVGAQVQVVNVNTIRISVTQAMPNNVNVVVIGTPNLAPPVNPADVASKSYVDARTPNLPAPVTSGTTIQTFTDALGDVWVAKNGVSGGNWARARAVLYCRCGRTTAMNTPAINGSVPMEVAYDDVYGMFTGPGITVPIGGHWAAGAAVEITPTATTDNLAIYIYFGGLPIRSGSTTANSALNVSRAGLSAMANMVAGQAIQILTEYMVAGRAITGGDGRTFLWAKYMGA